MMFSAASTESPTASQTNSEFGFEYIYIYIFDGIVREYFDHNIKKNSYLIF